jgi:hypothetical protein
MSGQASEAQIGGLLVGLASKGTTVEELIGAATVMREKAVAVGCSPGDDGVILDTCGTGGDVRGTFNISTAAAIIAAACGVKVVKHGNRSASSKSGRPTCSARREAQVLAETSPMRRSGEHLLRLRTQSPPGDETRSPARSHRDPTIFNCSDRSPIRAGETSTARRLRAGTDRSPGDRLEGLGGTRAGSSMPWTASMERRWGRRELEGDGQCTRRSTRA